MGVYLDFFCCSDTSTLTVLRGSLVSAYSTKIPTVERVESNHTAQGCISWMLSIPGNMMFFHNLPISFFSPSLFFLK